MKFYRILLTAAAVIAVMSLIFFFSSQDGSESAETSGRLVRIVTSMIPNFDELSAEEQFRLSEQIHFIIRKTAHFTEYTLLGFTLLLHIRTIYDYISKKPRAAWLLSWSIGVIYAALDEYHQSFSDARSPQIRDVLIDSAGAAAGVLLCTVVLMAIYKQRRQKEK